MATKTPNYNLTKPDMTDYADIRVINANMDIIDSELKAVAKLAQDNTGSGGGQGVDLSDYALKSQLNNYLPLTGGNIIGTLTINGKEVATKTTNKKGTNKGEEGSHWKTYLPDGRVMFKVNVSGSVVTLPVQMANTQYSIIQCDETVNMDDGKTYYTCTRGYANKTTTSFATWSIVQISNVGYHKTGWENRYTGTCNAIIIGWEA